MDDTRVGRYSKSQRDANTDRSRGDDRPLSFLWNAPMSRTLLTLAVLTGCVVMAPAAEPKKDARAKEVDAAISRALKYLQNNQQADGTWTGGRGGTPAITSLAVMAFLSAGHVP